MELHTQDSTRDPCPWPWVPAGQIGPPQTASAVVVHFSSVAPRGSAKGLRSTLFRVFVHKRRARASGAAPCSSASMRAGRNTGLGSGSLAALRPCCCNLVCAVTTHCCLAGMGRRMLREGREGRGSCPSAVALLSNTLTRKKGDAARLMNQGIDAAGPVQSEQDAVTWPARSLSCGFLRRLSSSVGIRCNGPRRVGCKGWVGEGETKKKWNLLGRSASLGRQCWEEAENLLADLPCLGMQPKP